MNPATLIRAAHRDGVRLTVSPAGTLRATGNDAALSRWLGVLRKHKAQVVEALQDDRVVCRDCRNLNEFGVCRVAHPWTPPSALRPVRHPVVGIPRRCDGYAPGAANDPDNRPGRERWSI